MVRPPATPTLFPYTTLFRSHRVGNEAQLRGKRSVRFRRPDADRARANRNLKTQPGTDRKSTRLNSSHMSTSYAVFCLKKNNHQLQAALRTVPDCCCARHRGRRSFRAVSLFLWCDPQRHLRSFPTRRSSDLTAWGMKRNYVGSGASGFGVRTLIELARTAT